MKGIGELGGFCSRWSQCQNDWGSWAVFLCVENTCVCNPYWGYVGEKCMEPTDLTIAQRYVFSFLFAAVFLYTILSLCFVKSYVLCNGKHLDQVSHQQRFLRRKLNAKGVAILVNAFISAPSAVLIVFGGLSAVTFDPKMHFLSSAFEICFAFGALGVNIQICVMSLTWIETALSIRPLRCLKRNWKKIKFAAYTYATLLSVTILVLQLARKSSSPQLALVFESIANLIGTVAIPIGLFGGLFLSSIMIKYGSEGSETHYEGKIIQKCALLMLIFVLGYSLFAVFSVFMNGVAGHGWLVAISNGLCVLFGLLFELVFLFYVDNFGLYFKARKNRARVHPIAHATPNTLDAHQIISAQRSYAEFS